MHRDIVNKDSSITLIEKQMFISPNHFSMNREGITLDQKTYDENHLTLVTNSIQSFVHD